MYIAINNVIGEKTINLSYPIHNCDSRKEITAISILSNNVQYEMKEPLKLRLMGGNEKQVLNGTYTIRELKIFAEGKFILTDLNNNSRDIKMNKLEKITDMIFNFDELDNSNNLEDGRPSNTLFTYYVSDSENFMHLEPKTPQYKKLKYGNIVSLTLRIMDQNNNIINYGPGTTVVLHI